MFEIVVRALQGAASVAIGIGAARVLGRGDAASLAAIPVGAVAMIAIEYALVIAPRRWTWARRRLDPRAVFEGVWLQDVRAGGDGIGAVATNRFAIFTVRYAPGSPAYTIEGIAYDPQGVEHSRWDATSDAQFTRNGRVMTYLWAGRVMGAAATGPDTRQGYAKLTLTTDDAGTGEVDHVGFAAKLTFNLRRIAAADVTAWRPGATPAGLADPTTREEFARAWLAGHLPGRATPRPAAPRP